MVSDRQVMALWRAYKQTGSIRKSALKANMNRKTAAKYISSRKLPSETEGDRRWKTHKDKIEPVWDIALSFLNNEPELEAKALFEHLLELHPDKIEPSQLRTFQRRVKEWRLIFGEEQEVYFDQISVPGEVAQLDWLVMNSLGIKICNEQFDHKLIHFTLKYSNTESVSICRSESILSIKKGLREFLYRVLGKAPQVLQVDNSSAATHRPKKDLKERAFNSEYLQILDYYGITARKTNVRAPHENGVVESQNGHLKSKIKQALLIRGSSNFNTIEEYENFLRVVIDKANLKRKKRFQEELPHLGQIPNKPLPEYQEEYVSIRNRSTANIKKVTYSVPSRLIGSKLKARIYEQKIELYSGTNCVHSMSRVLGDRGIIINYRHIIHSLIKKPGAFEGYKFKEELYPTVAFKKAFDFLIENNTYRNGVIEYLRLLKLAADNIEEDVDVGISLVLSETPSEFSYKKVLDLVSNREPETLCEMKLTPELNIYDDLFLSKGEENNETIYN